MNEKFYELKKAKQDKMLNAAMKVFALKGYDDAGTEAIAKEAGISKGLVFHYFGTKLEMFSYVYNYAVRYLLMEIQDGLNIGGKELIPLLLEIEGAVAKVLGTYPYLQLFLKRSALEQEEALVKEMSSMRNELETCLRGLLQEGDLTDYVEEEVQRILCVAEYIISGLLGQMLRNGSFMPDSFMTELKAQLTMLED